MPAYPGEFDPDITPKGSFDPEVDSGGSFTAELIATPAAASTQQVPYQPLYLVAPVMAQ